MFSLIAMLLILSVTALSVALVAREYNTATLLWADEYCNPSPRSYRAENEVLIASLHRAVQSPRYRSQAAARAFHNTVCR